MDPKAAQTSKSVMGNDLYCYKQGREKLQCKWHRLSFLTMEWGQGHAAGTEHTEWQVSDFYGCR